MKKQIFTLLALSIFVLFVFASFASATVSFSNIPTLSQTGNSFSISVSTDQNESINFTASTITDATGKTIIFTPLNNQSFSAETKTITINYTIQSNFVFQPGATYTTILTADGSVSPDATQNLTFEKIPEEVFACRTTGTAAGSDNDDLKLKIKDIDVKSGFGKDKEWYPLDEIEVEIEVENDNNDERMKDITVAWGLYNTETGEWYIDDEENDFTLKSKDKKTLTLTFGLDDDIDELSEGKYVFYVWANAVLDLDTDKELCTSAADDIISITIESDFVILDNIQIPEAVSCGEQIQITADVWNIGDADQKDVFVVISNEELGINEKITIGDIDKFDNEKLNVLINTPQDAEEKTYSLKLSVYDEYGDVFINSDDDKAVFTPLVKVEGNCVLDSHTVIVADLISGGKAGEEMAVKVTVTNTGTKSRTFAVSASDFSSWAELVSTNPESITLAKDETKDITITLNVLKDASGTKNFNVNLESDGKIITQPVSVLIEKSGFSLITGDFLNKDNWYLWGIGALNIVLVLIIIVVAVKLVRKG